MATLDEDGYLRIVDRGKDMIKSGGEWISSVDLENALMGHPSVREAAVIAVPHPKWDERPLAVVVRSPAQSSRRRSARISCAEIRQMAIAGRVRLCRRDSAHFGRQIHEDQTAPAICQLEVGKVAPASLPASCERTILQRANDRRPEKPETALVLIGRPPAIAVMSKRGRKCRQGRRRYFAA